MVGYVSVEEEDMVVFTGFTTRKGEDEKGERKIGLMSPLEVEEIN